jgi:NADPH:quinone reductase-like Zn-dependent oxidoreductase
VVSGQLKVAVSQTYPLADAARAIEDFGAKHTLGKLVITVP